MPTVRTQPRTIPPIPNSPPPGAIIFPRQSATSRNPQDLFANIPGTPLGPFFPPTSRGASHPYPTPLLKPIAPAKKPTLFQPKKHPGMTFLIPRCSQFYGPQSPHNSPRSPLGHNCTPLSVSRSFSAGRIIFPRQSAAPRTQTRTSLAYIPENSLRTLFPANLPWSFSPISSFSPKTRRPHQTANPVPTQKAPGHDLSHTRVLPILCPVITV